MTEQIVDETNTTSTDIGTTGNATVKTPATTDWAAAYKGLQSTYQKLKRDYDALVVTHDAYVAEHEKVKQDHETLKTRLQTLEGENLTHKAALSRTRLIMSEFPDLVGFEKEGILPGGDGDEEKLRTTLSRFRDVLKGQVNTSVQNQVSGATPPASSASNPSSQEEDEDYVWNQMSSHAGDRDPREFKKWQAKWDSIMAKKAKR